MPASPASPDGNKEVHEAKPSITDHQPTVEEVSPEPEKHESSSKLPPTMRMLVEKFASFLQFSVDYNDSS